MTEEELKVETVDNTQPKKALLVLKEEGVNGFMKRWGEGVQKVTPLQQTKVSIWFTIISIVGIALGIYVSWKNRVWWLLIVLSGALGIQGLSLLGIFQKKMILQKMEDSLKQFQYPQVSSEKKEVSYV